MERFIPLLIWIVFALAFVLITDGPRLWRAPGRRRDQRRTEARLKVEREAMSGRLAGLRPTNGSTFSERTRGRSERR